MGLIMWDKEKADIWNDSYAPPFNTPENVGGINRWERLGIVLPCSVHSTSDIFDLCPQHKPFLSNPNSREFFKDFSNGSLKSLYF